MVALVQGPNNNVYYGVIAFALFSPISVLYTAISHVFFARFVKIQPLPPAQTTPTAGTPKVAIVTGSNTGIGFETAKALAERGYVVILACRSRDKAVAAAATIPNSVFVQPLDLSSNASIAAFATTIQQTYTKIDVLVNNAGINTSGKLNGGLDLCFQSNFLGHFLLTQLLSPLLKHGRVVNLSSVMHHFVGNAPKDEVYWKRCTEYHSDQNTYSPSKLAAVLFTMELNRRGIRSMAVNPGAV
jgi:NAD(P)-dependent dehydrogenase (short-subunit alcohol dehydrogenase family)